MSEINPNDENQELNNESHEDNESHEESNYHFDDGTTIKVTSRPEETRNTSGNTFWKKFITVVLVVLLAGGSGYGGAYLYSRSHSGASGNTVLYQSVEKGNETGEDAVDQSNERVSVIANVKNTVVQINTESVETNSFFGNYVTSGAGSGVIITSTGYIVTNYHVIDGASTITVTLSDNTKYDAQVVGYDEDDDLAVLKIDATDLQAAVMGDSDNLSVGQSILVIGNPLGTLGGSVTTGIISALSREVTIENRQMTLLQIDAAVNPGNSGGALFDLSGNLVGIVNAKYEDESVEGIGFAIPINSAKKAIEDLISKGYVTGKVKLGVYLYDINSAEMAFRYGVSEYGTYIVKVNKGSDAEKAGLQVGDRFVSCDGTEIDSANTLISIVKSHEVGDTLKIVVSRDGKEVTVNVTLTEQGGNQNITNTSTGFYYNGTDEA